MSVTNYKIPCSYLEEGLSDELYLVSASHTKVVLVDADNHAEISGLSESPLRIKCAKVELSEESILDERYSFTKTVTATINGYANLSSLNEKYYCIAKTKGGMLLMVNVDFPSDVSYTYTLSDSTNNTVFTFTTLSNFPSLRLSNAFSDFISCEVYNVPCVKGLRLIGAENAFYSTANGSVQLFGDTFKDVDIYGKSLTFQETFNGKEVSTTLSFNMPLWWYKSYWHINLLEFQTNRYRAVIEGCDGNYIYAGFNYGLIPSFTITGDDEKSMITVTLTEASLQGSYFSDIFNPDGDVATMWDYVLTVDGQSYYECSEDEDGVGIYLLMAEVRGNGVRTGRYKVLEGHESEFTFLNVVGTFDDVVTFPNSDCEGGCGTGGGGIELIDLTIGQCREKAFGNYWYVNSVGNGLSVTPMSGTSADTMTICNVSVPVGETSVINMSKKNDLCHRYDFYEITIRSISSGTSVNPKYQSINCNAQNVTFTYSSNCPITITSLPSNITYVIGNSTITFSVPANTTTSARTFSIVVKDCRNVSETITINQDKVYEQWNVVSGEYVCEYGNKFEKERRYTGTTNSNYTPTNEYRTGSLIQSGSTDCSGSMYRWYDDGRFYCDGTTKYKALLEQVTYDGGVTWQYTGNARYGDNMGTDSSFCDGTETYSWQLTDKYDCYSPSGHDYSQDYLTFIALENGTFKFSGNSINYSIDNGQTWVSLASNTSTPTVSAGSKILWKGNCTPQTSTGIGKFTSTAQFDIEGNAMSLLFGDDFRGQMSLEGKNDAMYGLFRGNTNVVSAENLSLPATTLAQSCYYRMFYGCTNLTTAPELSATTLARGCYQDMFEGCTSLTTTPTVLPATTLTVACYSSMFSGCTSLTTAPELPATTLASSCYYSMFEGCTSLRTAPSRLPATTSAENCYRNMFANCTSLATAPELSAMTLARGCYQSMFSNATGLTTPPELPATTLATGCYEYMFQNCTSLTTAPSVLPATTLATGCYHNMFQNCTSLTTAPTLPATTLAEDCYNYMFYGCTSLTTAPELPATTLSQYCYHYMFYGCTSLTAAPELPATTLTQGCYYSMFAGCTSLNYIKAMFTTTPLDGYTYNWVFGVASTGTFVKNSAATWNVTGTSGIPNGWTVLEA